MLIPRMELPIPLHSPGRVLGFPKFFLVPTKKLDRFLYPIAAILHIAYHNTLTLSFCLFFFPNLSLYASGSYLHLTKAFLPSTLVHAPLLPPGSDGLLSFFATLFSAVAAFPLYVILLSHRPRVITAPF
ncbi:Hypothetical protein NTJ_03611 [Nesidiocoris tenuis]|uniref:Uncharacterized protein n=1 Tax=Nesidiocoris tenuis TaxID=355587 RepID=A0ABN7AFN8_9HEMI|nr:Hypothetical protein NTJ_03611 [Nesidiocoris tenuis]